MAQQHTLDLHGVRHADVKRKVIRFVERHWGHEMEAKIITGHSVKMKSLVKSVLDEYNLDYKSSNAFGTIKVWFE